MAETPSALTAKEKQTLRLLLEGYDAKSAARHLGLSVHTVNERLRDARRKLGVSSSREAARVLRESEQAAPQLSADQALGDEAGADAAQIGTPEPAASRLSRIGLIGGGTAMIFALALVAMSVDSSPDAASTHAAVQEAGAPTQAALAWLELVDRQDWAASYAATSTSFRKVNTLKLWSDASVGGRVPLGAVIARRLLDEIDAPMPPEGGFVVRFATSFANKPDTVETLSLVREGGSWKVVGYIIG